MKADLTKIHIGALIRQRVSECGIELSRISKFLQCGEDEINIMFNSESLDVEILLKWSKLLRYDFFRVYTGYLILHSPQSSVNNNLENRNSSLPRFRKNIYSEEVRDFILKLIDNGEKTKKQIIDEYNIPKATLYKWLDNLK